MIGAIVCHWVAFRNIGGVLGVDFGLSLMLIAFGIIVVDLFAGAGVTDLVEVIVIDKSSANIDEESDQLSGKSSYSDSVAGDGDLGSGR